MKLHLSAPPEWVSRAACVGHDPELWFPTMDGRSSAEAKAICRRCPVATECLAAALEHDEWGVWGATTDEQRRAALGKPRRRG